MHPLDQSHKSPRRVFRVSIRTAFKLLAICLIAVSVPLALYVRVKSEYAAALFNDSGAVKAGVKKASKCEVIVRAAGRGMPYLNVQDGRKASGEYRGDSALASALQNGPAQARALASADFKRNGIPAVVAGYAFNG